MQALDWESFEFRAQFFNRSLEEELIGCLDGQRGGEARAHLERIARQRATTIERLIQNELHRTNSKISYPNISENESAPSKIFQVTECSICNSDDSNNFGVLACGHVICKDCFQEMKKFPTLYQENAVKCPECRKPSKNLFAYCINEINNSEIEDNNSETEDNKSNEISQQDEDNNECKKMSHLKKDKSNESTTTQNKQSNSIENMQNICCSVLTYIKRCKVH